jgi:hypothetical protein
MQVLRTFGPLVIITTLLLDWTSLPRANAGCPCTGNSPIVNTFPVRSLRWGTGRVLRGTDNCEITKFKGPRIAIGKVADSDQPGAVRGYQLVIVDRDNVTQCVGSKLAGIVFDQLYADHDEPVVVRQVAKAKVTPDSPQKEACFLDEYRFVYMISAASRPDDSVCTHGLNNDWLSRQGRRGNQDIPSFKLTEISSSPADLLEIYPKQLADYAVIIPDAEYDINGNPHTDSSVGLPKVPDKNLEWYELACANGALAHTDLNGLVELGENKEIRTAAMRMLQGKYVNNQTETNKGIPISFRRDRPHSPEYRDLCEKSTKHPKIGDIAAKGVDGKSREARGIEARGIEVRDIEARDIEAKDIEARWTTHGAMCMSHSRLWMKDSAIDKARKYPAPTLGASEHLFMDHLKGLKHAKGDPDLKVPCDSMSDGDPKSGVYFTSGVVHHIHHDPSAPASQDSSPISHP